MLNLQRLSINSKQIKMPKLYLGLGSNIGDKKQNITNATIICGSLLGEIVALSSLYETEPWGFESDNLFMNAAICVQTDHQPRVCLEMTKAIEREMGRVQKSADGVYHDRIIDIDILFYDDVIVKTDDLTIPHPLMAERDFVLRPLAEIAPDLIHPETKISVSKMLERLGKNI